MAWLAVAIVALLADSAGAAEWGAIVPGQSTVESVRAQYGEPSRSGPLKIEGYDAMEWVYEGERAPRGIRQLAIEFGLLTDAGYRADLVRIFRIEPVPGVFTRTTILQGWGPPTKVGKDAETPLFFYQEGLLVEFDSQGWLARRMMFTPPQPKRDD